MKRFFENLRRYKGYAMFSAVASLRADVSGSYFSWLWWILDPFLFMMIYTFISVVVFGKSEPHFVPFVFLGMSTWNLINRGINQSVRVIRGNKGILSRIYLPKYILLLSHLVEYFFQFLITMGLCIVMAVIDKVHFTWNVLWIPLIVADLMIVTFGVCCILMHCGVYARDFSNIISAILRLLFYLSGIFYSIPKNVPAPFGTWLLVLNPAGMFINEMRKVFIYSTPPNLSLLGIWFVIGVGLTAIGVSLIHKYEQSYVKAI